MTHSPATLIFVVFILVAVPFGGTAAVKAPRSYDEGLGAIRRGDNEEAIKLISQAIEMSPPEARYFNDRGVAYKRAGKLDEALADYTKALEIKPDYVNALNNRAVVYIEKGLYDKAVQDCTEAAGHGELLSKIYTNRGLSYAGMGDHTKAVEDYRRAVSYRPVDSRAFVFLAESLWKSGEKEQALQMFQLAAGLAKEPRTSDMLEKEIARLEKMFSEAEQPPPRQASPTVARKTSGGQRSVKTAPTIKKPPDTPKDATTAGRPLEDKGESPGQKHAVVPDSLIETPGQLDSRCRDKHLKSFSAEVADMYRLGRQHLEKADPHKALVRFEDTLQLAKKNRNTLGAAWMALEIGRVHLGLGDHIKAAPHFADALKTFSRLKATDEMILTAIEIAWAKRAGGMIREAEELFARVRASAISAGHVRLADAVDQADARRPTAPQRTASVAPRQESPAMKKEAPEIARPTRQVEPPGNSPMRKDERTDSAREKDRERTAVGPAAQLDRPQATGAFRHMHAVGRGPSVLEQTGKTPGRGLVPERQSRPPYASLPRAPEPEKRREPEREVFWVKAHARPEHSIADDLALLNRLKADNDETGMIMVLERLSTLYERQKKDEKALHALTASLGFREKLGRTDEAAGLFFRAGLLREKMGQKTTALEDYTRGAALARAEGKIELARAMSAKAKKLAKQGGLDPEGIPAALEALWEARIEGNEAVETRAFHRIAALYERAGMLPEAESYYARLEASTLAQRATLMEKTGRSEQALQTRDKAAQAFKKLDYSRFLQMMKRSKEPEKPAVQKHSRTQADLQGR